MKFSNQFEVFVILFGMFLDLYFSVDFLLCPPFFVVNCNYNFLDLLEI